MRPPRGALGVAGALLLGGAALLGGRAGHRALDRDGPLSDPDPEGAPAPPVATEALWGGPLAQAAPGAAVARSLDHHPALVLAAAGRPDPGGAPAGQRLVAERSLDPRLAEALRARLRLPAAELAWLLDPALAAAARTGCPDPALGGLCDPGQAEVVAAQVDVVLGDLVGDPEPEVAMAARAVACRLPAPRALALGRAALAGPDLREAAAGLRVLACALPPDEARAALRAHLDAGDPLAPVAALELRRLGAPAANLGDRPGDGTSTGVIAAWAAGR